MAFWPSGGTISSEHPILRAFLQKPPGRWLVRPTMALLVRASRWTTRHLPRGRHGLRVGVQAKNGPAGVNLESALDLVAQYSPDTLEYLRTIDLRLLVAPLRDGGQCRLHRFTPTLTFSPEYLLREATTVVAQLIVYQAELARHASTDPLGADPPPSAVAEAKHRASAILGPRLSQ